MTLTRLRALVIAALLAIILTPVLACAQAVQVPPAEVCFQATTGINGMIGTLGALSPGAGGTPGTYTNVPLIGGSGTGASANITVNSSGQVSQVVVYYPGINYVVGDTLTALTANIGNVIGFSVPVASISINSSLAGGTVGMYQPGTLIYAQTWQNANQTTLNTNPIQLDASGCAIIYGVGTYRQILYDSLGNEVWDQLTSVSPINPFWAGLAGGTGNAITLNDGSFAATNGQSLQFIVAANNTGATTITVNGSTYPVDKNSGAGIVPLSGGELAANNIANVTYYATNGVFILTNSITSAISNAFGQGQLVPVSSTQISFNPYQGNLITIAGTNYSIPSGGISATITNVYINGVAGQTLSASTLYYVYLFNNAGTLTLNFSTTGHSTDTTAGNVGVEIMTGNNANSLVGMVYPLAGPIFSYTGQNALVISWFNRHGISVQGSFTTIRSTTSTTPVEINSEIGVNVLSWTNEVIVTSAVGSVEAAASGDTITTEIGINADILSFTSILEQSFAGSAWMPFGMSISIGVITEGLSYISLFGDITAGTASWLPTSTISVNIRG